MDRQQSLFGAQEAPAAPALERGIGGGELAAMLGLDPRLRAEALWRRKTGRPLSDEPSAAMRRGVALEPTVKALYTQCTGEAVAPGRRALHPRWAEGVAMVAATDGWLPWGGILETKTSRAGTDRAEALRAGVIPVEYALQVQLYAAVHQADGALAALLGPAQHEDWLRRPWELIVIRWRRLPALCARLEELVARWCADHLQADQPPPDAHPEAAQIAALLAQERWCEPPRAFAGDRLELPRAARQMTLF
jgi:predicted phage-related endonuclease